MSKEAKTVCDCAGCNEEYQTEPALYGGTLHHLSEWVNTTYGGRSYDFCSLKCLIKWAEAKIKKQGEVGGY